MARPKSKSVKPRKNLTLKQELIDDVDSVNEFNSFSELVENLLESYVEARKGKKTRTPAKANVDSAASKVAKK